MPNQSNTPRNARINTLIGLLLVITVYIWLGVYRAVVATLLAVLVLLAVDASVIIIGGILVPKFIPRIRHITDTRKKPTITEGDD